jgi:hypothetical protein
MMSVPIRGRPPADGNRCVLLAVLLCRMHVTVGSEDLVDPVTHDLEAFMLTGRVKTGVDDNSFNRGTMLVGGRSVPALWLCDTRESTTSAAQFTKGSPEDELQGQPSLGQSLVRARGPVRWASLPCAVCVIRHAK